MFKFIKQHIPVMVSALLFTGAVKANDSDSLTRKDYENAARFLGAPVQKYVFNTALRPNWIDNDQFWYLSATAAGKEFVFVDPARKIKQAAFNHTQLAEALSQATGNTYKANELPFQQISYARDKKSITFVVDKTTWIYTLSSRKLEKTAAAGLNSNTNDATGFGQRRGRNEIVSPDGKTAAFLRDYNLWIKDLASQKETQLTTDGVKNFGYATDNAGWTTSTGTIIKWSPDSKKIATYKQDERHVKDMYLVTTNVGAPELKAWKYPLPGDSAIIMIHRLIIDVPSKKIIPLQVAADPRRSSMSDNITNGGELADVHWSPDASELAFLSTSRDHKISKMRIANAATGSVREVFEEIVPTHYESGRGDINWKYLPQSKEFIWYSQRDNWGHLYLYDAINGNVKNQITKGAFVVTRITEIDEAKRQIWFYTTGLDTKNPYFQHLCRIDFDGKNFTDLTPATGTHQVIWSPSKKYLIDTYSQPDVPQTFDLRDANGKLISNLGGADISLLPQTGWTPPTAVSVKAADGKTDIYGVVFTPSKMVAGKKYPVVNYIYPGPQGGSVGSWSYSAVRGDHRALAELGFIVVIIEGTSNPFRSKSYHDMNYGNMSENTLPDQITAIKQLAEKFPIDLNKVGIWGHSGGGFATAAAMFRYPDFYKVGISESGNHDNRNYEDDWGERYNGLAENVNYAAQANQTYAKNLKGKLMLAHGMMDNNVPPYNTLLVVEALQKANKDFDLVIFPSATHGFGQYSNYMMRLRWDYFVKHLQGVTPPKEFDITAFLSTLN